MLQCVTSLSFIISPVRFKSAFVLLLANQTEKKEREDCLESSPISFLNFVFFPSKSSRVLLLKLNNTLSLLSMGQEINSTVEFSSSQFCLYGAFN